MLIAFYFFINYDEYVLLSLLKIIFSIGMMVSKNLGISAPVITSTASNLFILFNEGLSPADIGF